jgi:DNA primase
MCSVDSVAEIKNKLDLVEYIGRVVQLQKSGRNFKARCPFHAEKTPSFYVFPDRATWRCFGSCGEGGDLFTFVQKRENLDFRGALQELAREAGVQLSPEGTQRRSRMEQLSRVMSVAVDYYQGQLRGASGEDAQAYLTERRGLTSEAIEAFRLGWAPDEWRGLRGHFESRGIDATDGVAAGLLVEPETAGRDPYDRFRGRITVPIADERGLYVGMGGRGLQGEEPKYLNTPQSELFDKGRTLYGLNLAAPGIRAAGEVVVVEGYMDVIGPWQAGFRNVVATMGTSLTEHHVGMLRRFARRIVLALDPDAAGAAATERAGGLLLDLASPEAMARSAHSAEAIVGSAQIDLRVAVLPAGKDPDEVARGDPEAWRRAVASSIPFAQFLLQRVMGGHAPASPVEARQTVDRLKPILNAVTDPVERARYVGGIARFFGVREREVWDRIKASSQGSRRPAGEDPGPPANREEMLLGILLRHEGLRQNVRSLPPDLFNESVNRELFRRWLAAEEPSVEEDDPITVQAGRLVRLRLPPLGAEDARKAASRKVEEILRDRLIQRQAAVSEEVAEAEREFGADHVARVSNDAWRGALPPDNAVLLAQSVIEELELGMSIHRQEVTELF